MTTATPTSHAPREAPPTTVGLVALAVGEVAVIREAHLDRDDAALLRAMGLGPGVRFKLCRQGEPCIVAIMPSCCGVAGPGADLPCCAGRIGLARSLARAIVVSRVEA